MYLCDYVQESVHGKEPVTSTYGHNCAIYISNYPPKYIYDQKILTEKYFKICTFIYI